VCLRDFLVPGENGLSMLDAARVDAADRSPAPSKSSASGIGPIATPRRRALAACAVLALLVHGAFVGGIGSVAIGTTAEPAAAPVSLRAIPAAAGETRGDPTTASAETPELVPTPVAPAPAPKPRAVRRPREPTAPMKEPAAVAERAGARIEEAASVPSPAFAASEAAATGDPVIARAAPAEAPPSPAPVEAASAPMAAGPGASAAASPTLLAAGEQPPPVYRTRLPPSVTLRYEVRRGFLRGTGEIRWQASGETYRLVLEARIAGLTLLTQTSEGTIDANGLAPRRFLDQRARRSAQAANFRRDVDRITFSGPAVEWPLLPGSQDRLSWMIQLAGIAAAEPGLVAEGSRISMVVVGARGEAAVWTLRSAGREDVETAWGTVRAIKLVREGHSLYDTNAEIWLDPERDYLPAHATLRNSAGASEYDLLLERVEPAS
jgi:hypothetical protein